MADVTTDLLTVIGLSERACDCYPANPGNWATINASKSGLYVDNIQYGPDLSIPIQDNDCEDDTIHTLLENSRKDGLKRLVTDYMAALSRAAKPLIQGHKGTIGEDSRSTAVKGGLTKDFVGMSIHPKKAWKQVEIQFDQIYLKVNTSASFDVFLYDMDDLSSPVDTFTINTTAGSKTGTGALSGKVFPLWKRDKPINYALVYDRNGAKPHNIETYCGCGSDAVWVQRGIIYTAGFEENAISEMDHWYSKNKNTMGLVVDFQLKCSGMNWMTEVDDNFWTDTAFGRVFSQAFQMYSDWVLLTKLITSSSLNSYVLMNYESLVRLRASITKMLDEMIPWLAERQPEGVSHCHICRPIHNITRDEILI